MKHKFRSMGRVAIAVVLALSLCLMTAVPVAATHTSTAVVAFQAEASTVASEASILDVAVTNGSSGCAINTVKIDFSESDFAVTGPGTVPDNWTGAGPANDVVTYTAAAGFEIALDTTVTFSPAVTNPLIFGEATVPAVLTTDIGSKAAVDAAEDTGWIGYVADSVGIGGNAITVEYVDPFSENSPLSVSVLVKAITVSLATDEVGALTSTASEVATAINGDGAAGALVDATVETGHEADVLTALAVPALTGGISANVDKACTVTPATLTVTSIVPVSFEVVAGADNTVTAGEAFSVTITAKDEAAGAGATETKYAGDHFITFTTGGDPIGTIPGFELISFTNGVGTSLQNFILTDATQTTVTITATDELSVAGESDEITINLPALDNFVITGGTTPVTAGVAFDTDVTVTAYDSLDNVKTDYTGTVSWTSSDPSAELPDAHALVAGTYTFAMADFILKTVGEGTQTITVTSDGVSETASITVNPAAASEIQVTAAPTSIRADNINASTITATAYDEFGNVDINFAETATFAVSLGTLSNPDANFGTTTAGKATATLKSDGVVGTATVKVTPGTLSPYKTVTVTLVAPSLLAEVWVDATDGDDANSGTEAEPFATIPAAITAAAEGGTVTVAGGTYTPAATGVSVIVVDKELTLQAAAGSTPIIEAVRDGASAYHVVVIAANNVTIDGFTIVEDGGAVNGDWGIYVVGDHENFVIQNNTVTGFDDTNDVGIRVMTTILTSSTSGLIKDNTSEANSNGIEVSNVQYVTIQGNLVQNNTGDGISLFSGSSHITVIENKVYSNAGGIFASVDSSGIFHQNHIVGNSTWYGLKYEGTVPIDATNNWWGDASGPTHVSNPTGTGDKVSSTGSTSYFVDYTPWLLAPPAEPVTPVTTISLESGWNLISLPLIPTSSAITDVLAGLITAETVDWVDTFVYENGLLVEKKWDPPAILQNTLMSAGQGYWVNMTAGDTLTISGLELPAPPNVPPTYQVYEGWNLIGVKSVNLIPVAQYLGGVVTATIEVIYSYDATNEVYELVLSGGNFVPGHGYWLAVSADGTIYP